MVNLRKRLIFSDQVEALISMLTVKLSRHLKPQLGYQKPQLWESEAAQPQLLTLNRL